MEMKAVRHATTATTYPSLNSGRSSRLRHTWTARVRQWLSVHQCWLHKNTEFDTPPQHHTTPQQIDWPSMKKAPDAPLRDNLSQFLFQYRMTPHSTTGISPSELLLNRRPRSKLDLAIPNLTQKVRAKQLKQKIGLMISMLWLRSSILEPAQLKVQLALCLSTLPWWLVRQHLRPHSRIYHPAPVYRQSITWQDSPTGTLDSGMPSTATIQALGLPTFQSDSSPTMLLPPSASI